MMTQAEAGLKSLLIVYHSFTGATGQLAQAIADGASGEAGVRVSVRRANDTDPADVLAADGYVFATPENLAAMSGLLKDFFDRSYYAALDRINGRPYAIAICAGSDGQNAARQIERIATGWRLRQITAPLIVCTRAQTTEAILAPKQLLPEQLAAGRTLGETFASGLAMGVF